MLYRNSAHKRHTAPFAGIIAKLADKLPPSVIDQLCEFVERDGEAIWQLRFADGARYFNQSELQFISTLTCDRPPIAGALRPHMVVILKATRLCNLRCTYCHSWRAGPGNIMPIEVLARITHDVLADPAVGAVDFVWHGGEVTLLPTSYVERALWLQQHFSHPNVQIVNSIQTNATLLSADWINLFKSYKFSVGVSIDGPPEIHDLRRRTIKGDATSRRVADGLNMLRDAGIPFGALAVIDECALSAGPRAYLDYLVSTGAPAVAVLNALPQNSASSEDVWFTWARFTNFLRDLFREWWNDYRQVIVVRELQSLVEAVQQGRTGLCIFSKNCMGGYLTIEPNGDVLACDKYVGDIDFVFGNVNNVSLSSMLRNSVSLKNAKQVVDRAKSATSQCSNFAVCTGGCPHDIRLRSRHGREEQIACCGLFELIEDIRSTV